MIGFNYLGEMSAQDSNDGALFAAMTEISAGDDFAPQNVFGPDISINCSVIDGKLEAGLAYNIALFTEEQATLLLNGMMESLREITAHTSEMTDVEVTATDLGEYEWTDEGSQTRWLIVWYQDSHSTSCPRSSRCATPLISWEPSTRC